MATLLIEHHNVDKYLHPLSQLSTNAECLGKHVQPTGT
jgi:hypothetical protein